MFEAEVAVPRPELETRWTKCRAALRETAPEASGLLVFTRLQIYYLTGTLAQGVVWLPINDDAAPVLMVRKGLERARMESSLERIASYKSYSQLAGVAAEFGAPFGPVLAVDKAGLTWQLADMLTARVKGATFVSGDMALNLARMRKSEWELVRLREAGRRHHHALHEVLPGMIRPGMTERDIAHKTWEAFYAGGHQGIMRMQGFGEEIFLGHIAAGDNGNYPSAFNGPLGLRGEHPATPYMGSAERVWEPGTPLSLDVGWVHEGYHTDKTQIYWAGPESSLPGEVRAAHDFCIDIQAGLAERMRPGATASDAYLYCLKEAEARGFAEGFMGLGDNKVPFVGHGIGLAIDGYPPIAKGFDLPLEAGMTFAFEPKQGVPGVGMVGVENTFEITEDGAVCITGDRYDMLCIE